MSSSKVTFLSILSHKYLVFASFYVFNFLLYCLICFLFYLVPYVNYLSIHKHTCKNKYVQQKNETQKRAKKIILVFYIIKGNILNLL